MILHQVQTEESESITPVNKSDNHPVLCCSRPVIVNNQCVDFMNNKWALNLNCKPNAVRVLEHHKDSVEMSPDYE